MGYVSKIGTEDTSHSIADKIVLIESADPDMIGYSRTK